MLKITGPLRPPSKFEPPPPRHPPVPLPIHDSKPCFVTVTSRRRNAICSIVMFKSRSIFRSTIRSTPRFESKRRSEQRNRWRGGGGFRFETQKVGTLSNILQKSFVQCSGVKWRTTQHVMNQYDQILLKDGAR